MNPKIYHFEDLHNYIDLFNMVLKVMESKIDI